MNNIYELEGFADLTLSAVDLNSMSLRIAKLIRVSNDASFFCAL